MYICLVGVPEEDQSNKAKNTKNYNKTLLE